MKIIKTFLACCIAAYASQLFLESARAETSSGASVQVSTNLDAKSAAKHH